MRRNTIAIFMLLMLFSGIKCLQAQDNFSEEPPSILIKLYGAERVEELRKIAPEKYKLALWNIANSYKPEGLSPEEEKAFRDTFNLRKYSLLRQETKDTTIFVGNYKVTLFSYQYIEKRLKKEEPVLYELYSTIWFPGRSKEPTSKIRKP